MAQAPLPTGRGGCVVRRGVAVAALALSHVWLAACGSRSGVMSWQQYAETRHQTPYVLEATRETGELLYFGASHMGEMVGKPILPQTEQIERAWARYRPEVAFYEGRSTYGAELPTVLDAAKRAGEPGVVNFLAARDRVPAHSLEPTLEEEVAELRRHFTAEQVRLYYVLRCVSQRCTGPGTPEEQVERWLQRREGTSPSLPGPPRSIDEVATMTARLLPHLGAWQDVSAQDRDPIPRAGRRGTFLSEISRRSSIMRDEQMVRTLVRAVRRGQRVFAVMGASHVVMQESALRSSGLVVRRVEP